MAAAPILKHLDDLKAHRISPGDTVSLVPLTGPSDGAPTSAFFEIWDPQGVQPDNSHPDSVEIFIILEGEGEAVSDEHTVAIKAGDVLVLPSGSVHHIRNTSAESRLYAVTIMANDLGSQPDSTTSGFEALVKNGAEVEFEAVDKAAIFRSLAALAG
jgi:mannose-6-phosphate isomerase-like protein (cupin superfamily)